MIFLKIESEKQRNEPPTSSQEGKGLSNKLSLILFQN